jgi:hypothetical protein
MAMKNDEFEVHDWEGGVEPPPVSNPDFPVYEEETNGTGKPQGRSLKTYLLYGLIGISVVGIMVGIAVGVSSSKTSEVNPVMAPTMFEDGTPGPTPTTANEVMDAIFNAARNGGTEFENPESYQSKALTWVMTQTLPATQYPNLGMEDQALQLYALACIFFSTYSQRNAWTDFHFGEGVALPGWFSNRGWLMRAGEVCDWHGITCNGENRVSKIELDTNGLTGSFPPEVAYLKDSLTYLDLYNNLVHNKGDAGNAFLGELVNLEYLFFGTTSFEYDGVPTHLGTLTKLKELDFSYSLYFGALPEGIWGGMTELNYLVMDGNAYNSTLPQDLVSLPNLEYLYAGFSFLEGDISFIADMPKIFELWLDDNQGFGGPLPAAIATKDTLVSLSLTNCALTGTIPTEIGLMQDMIQMWLYGNELSGAIPTQLGALQKLKLLNLQANVLTGIMPDELCNRRTPFGRLDELEADCDGEVTCSETCCTCCGEQCIES